MKQVNINDLWYNFAGLRVVGVSSALSEGGKLAFLAHELAHVSQHPASSDNRYYPPDDLVLLRRLREAAAEAVATRIAWELRENGDGAAWDERVATPYGDVARGFETVAADASREAVLAPRKQRDLWTLKGVALVRSAAGEVARKPYTAVVRSLCDAYAQRRCWALQKLSLGAGAKRTAAPAPSKTLRGSRRILGIQRRLKAVGFEPGPLDGRMGPRTGKAVRVYQRAYGLAADGRPSGDLLDRLEIDALFLRGLRYFNDGDYRRAMGQYARIIELRPDSSDAYFNHGLIYHRMGLHDLAIGDYDAAVRLRPGHVQALRDRGNTYYEKGLYGAAARDYAASLTSWPFGGMAFDRIDQGLAVVIYALGRVGKG